MAWKNVQYENGKMRTSSGGGGGGASNFADLEDVDLSNLQDGQVPKYNSSTQKWENANESGGSGHNYSTTEQVVGTWIDGKPVYEKTYALNGFQINQDWTTSNITEPIDKVIKADLIDEYNQHFTCEVGLSATSPSGYYSVELATRYPSSSNRRFNYLIMEYTKTTD